MRRRICRPPASATAPINSRCSPVCSTNAPPTRASASCSPTSKARRSLTDPDLRRGGQRPRIPPRLRPLDPAAARRWSRRVRGSRPLPSRSGPPRGSTPTSLDFDRGSKRSSLSSGARRTVSATSDHPYDALLEEYEPGARDRRHRRPVRRAARGTDCRWSTRWPTRAAGRTRRFCGATIRSTGSASSAKWRRRRSASTSTPADSTRRRIRSSHRSAPATAASPRATSAASSTTAFFATLHEVGHALYEQGLPPEHYGTPLGTPTSLAMHEVAIAAVGEHRRPQPAVLGAFLPAGSPDCFPRHSAT